MKEALILFSGGKDSFLSTLKILDQGYKVNLVTFDNGLELNSKNVLVGAKKIQKKYGPDKVKILGIKKIDAIFREFICAFYNYDIEYIKKEFGQITISQFNCLACRLSMYVLAILISKKNKINLVVDGARKSQLFVIEQNKMINLFKNLFKKYDLEIIYPLLEEEDDFTIKNQILAHGFVSKMNECQCLLGMPVKEKSINDAIIEGVIAAYQKELYPKIDKLLKDYKEIEFGEEYI